MGAEGEPPLASGPAWRHPLRTSSQREGFCLRGGRLPTAADRSVPGVRQGARGSRGPCSQGRMSGPAFVRSLFKGGKGHQESLDLGPRLGRWNATAVGSQSASIPARPHRPQVQCAAPALYQGSVRGPGCSSHRSSVPTVPWVTFVSPLWVFALIPLSITNKHSGSGVRLRVDTASLCR